jgi:hypothetical protein
LCISVFALCLGRSFDEVSLVNPRQTAAKLLLVHVSAGTFDRADRASVAIHIMLDDADGLAGD